MKEALSRIWILLARALEQRTPFTAMQLATVGEDGAAKLRAIILRRFDPAGATVSFITDGRAAKVQEIRRNPGVSLGGYDPASSLQLRLEGTAHTVAHESERAEVWTALRPHTHGLFRTPFTPGTPLEAHDEGPVSAGTSSDLPHEHFCLIRVRLQRVELLDLSAEPHARSQFTRGNQGWIGARIAP